MTLWARLGIMGVAGLALACEAGPVGNEEPIMEVQEAVSAPLAKAYCSIPVTGVGTKNMEDDYLPHVITCENGGANLQALKAQAIAARSVAYYAMATKGSICDGQGCQVYTCGANPSAKAIQAVKETAGIYLSFGGMLTYGFYVSGDNNTSAPSCKGSSSHPMEKYVTYNWGLTGTSVKQTSLGYIGPPGYGQNRGCMSQWGARCLEANKSYDYKQILQFYYGADIKLLTATGSCVAPAVSDGDGVTDACDTDDDNDSVADTTDNCPLVANKAQNDADKDGKGDACDGDDDGDGVADASDNCPALANANQGDLDQDGKGDACDDDDDGDAVADASDNCPEDANASQADADGDGLGDACDGSSGSGGASGGGGQSGGGGSAGSGGKAGSGGSGAQAGGGSSGSAGGGNEDMTDADEASGCSTSGAPAGSGRGALCSMLALAALRRRRRAA